MEETNKSDKKNISELMNIKQGLVRLQRTSDNGFILFGTVNEPYHFFFMDFPVKEKFSRRMF